MRRLLKNGLNSILLKTLSHRLVHDRLFVGSDYDVWRKLKKAGFSPNLIVDVGAAKGHWTKSVMDIYPDANFLMIDPLSENELALKKVITENSKVNYWMGAIGRTAGELKIHAHGPQSSMYASEWGGDVRSVPMRTLDECVIGKFSGRVDGLKIDVQGAELEVLAGATEVLKTCQVVQVEASFRQIYQESPLAHEIISYFSDKGFRIYDLASAIKRKEDGALLQADFFFVSNDEYFSPETWELSL